MQDLPESLTAGKERLYINWFYKNNMYNPEAITEDDIDMYASKYSAPGGMRGASEYYRAFAEDAADNQKYAKTKLEMPVLVVNGDFYPLLGGKAPVNFTLVSMKLLAEDIKDIMMPNTGHFVAEEQPERLAGELEAFFRNA